MFGWKQKAAVLRAKGVGYVRLSTNAYINCDPEASMYIFSPIK